MSPSLGRFGEGLSKWAALNAAELASENPLVVSEVFSIVYSSNELFDLSLLEDGSERATHNTIINRFANDK